MSNNWSEEEDGILRQAYLDGGGPKLGFDRLLEAGYRRPYTAVRAHAAVRGYGNPHRIRLTTAQESVLLQMPLDGAPIDLMDVSDGRPNNSGLSRVISSLVDKRLIRSVGFDLYRLSLRGLIIRRQIDV